MFINVKQQEELTKQPRYLWEAKVILSVLGFGALFLLLNQHILKLFKFYLSNWETTRLPHKNEVWTKIDTCNWKIILITMFKHRCLSSWKKGSCISHMICMVLIDFSTHCISQNQLMSTEVSLYRGSFEIYPVCSLFKTQPPVKYIWNFHTFLFVHNFPKYTTILYFYFLSILFGYNLCEMNSVSNKHFQTFEQVNYNILHWKGCTIKETLPGMLLMMALVS